MDDLIDELFADIQILDESDSAATEHEVLLVLHDLPERYADQYTATFAKNFLCAAVVLRHQLAEPEWAGPRTIADAHALQLLKTRALTQLEVAGLFDGLPIEPMLAAFDEHVFADWDVDALYDEDHEPDGDDDVLAWFEPAAVDSEAESMHATV
jgi:hypothetical protein